MPTNITRKEVTDSAVAHKFLQIELRARQKGLEFDMTLSRVKTLLNTKRCFFTNKQMNYSDKKNDPMQISFDRIDNSKGYTNANVVACTTQINMIKSNISIENIELIYKGIQKHNK